MRTQVECQVVSKKEVQNWNAEFPIATEIELQVPYDQKSIYHKLSGGTNMVLRTVNPEAANMFTVGSKYMLTVEPVAVEEEAQASV